MSFVILKRAVLPLLFVVPHWLQLIPFNIVANMQMALSIYQTVRGYPLLIQHKLGAGPCQSNSHSNVLPLGTVQLIKAAFVWGRICASQESAEHGFSTSCRRPPSGLQDCLLTLLKTPHKIMQNWKCTQEVSPDQTRPDQTTPAPSRPDQLPWQMQVAFTLCGQSRLLKIPATAAATAAACE